MGQALSNVIKSIDGSADAEKQIQDALESLYALGESRNDAAWAQANSDALKVYAPISKVLLRRQSIIASASVGTDQIVNGIKKAVGKMMGGQILDGVTDIIGNALDVVLGASSGRKTHSYTYALVATDLGALLRLDIDIFSFEIRSKGLQNHAKNMTAITSIISTVDPKSLTLSDLRGIVSLSYGGSPLARQKEVFDLVRIAWENDRKIALGEVLTQQDHDNFRALLKPSVYEAEAALRATNLHNNDEPAILKMDRTQLRRAYQDWQSKAQASRDTSTLPASEVAALPVPPVNMVNIYLWFMVTSQVDEEWIPRMAGAISGFDEAGMLKSEGMYGGFSGNAVTFTCKVNADATLFNKCVRYVHDQVLPNLRAAPYLTAAVSQMALQFEHPNAGATHGLATSVLFKSNRITNKTDRDIRFFDGTNHILTIYIGKEAIVSGHVDHLEAVPPAPTATPGSTAAAPPAAGTVTARPQYLQSTQWITYDPAPNVVQKVEMSIHGLGQDAGYALRTNDGRDAEVIISYNVAWTDDRDGRATT